MYRTRKMERWLRKSLGKVENASIEWVGEVCYNQEKGQKEGWMDMDEKLGKRIAALRRKRGWTQEKLAQQLA